MQAALLEACCCKDQSVTGILLTRLNLCTAPQGIFVKILLAAQTSISIRAKPKEKAKEANFSLLWDTIISLVHEVSTTEEKTEQTGDRINSV